MARFDILTAVAAPLAIDNIDTDQVFPGRFSSRPRKDGNFGVYYLHDRRFDKDGNPIEDFILNDKRLHDVQIIVAGSNYACGSGRAGALFAQVDYGMRAVIADSFGAVFSSVAYKSGILTVQLSHQQVANLTEQLMANLGATITIDLPKQEVIAPDGERMGFEIDPFVKRMIAEGLNEIDFTLALDPAISAFEAEQRKRLPWVFEGR